jgi:II/X family phage/plasmid replication protein
MLIDWITMRFPLTPVLGHTLHQRILDSLGQVVKFDPAGEIIWQKLHVDFDELRSDSMGLYWSLTADADSTRYLTLGASPASLNQAGINVFGTLSIPDAAKTILRFACMALECVLPSWEQWQCRRLDITANYDMGNAAQVKQALSLLLATDAPRRRTNSNLRGGDTVYWNPTSDLQSGKAYHKGAHLRMQLRKGNIVIDDEQLNLADNLLRLELKLGSRWFRRHAESGLDWQKLSPKKLTEIHQNFFNSLIGGGDIEVNDMGNLLIELERTAPSKGSALAAHRTFALIKVLGYAQTKNSMAARTFFLHTALLRAAGLSGADLCAGKILALRKRTLVLENPVLGWSEIRKVA